MKIRKTFFVTLLVQTVLIIVGKGAIIAQQDFESSPAGPVATYTTTGAWLLQSGSVTGTFSPSTSTWGASGRGIGADANSATIVFDPIDTSGFTGVGLNFRLAALSGTGSSANGMELADTFRVEISPNNGTTWYSQILVTGSTGANARWSFADGVGTATVGYSTTTSTTFSPTTGGIQTTQGYSAISVTGLPSVSQLKIRLTATDDNANERWLVDSLVVSGSPVVAPEPGSMFLGALGLMCILRRCR